MSREKLPPKGQLHIGSHTSRGCDVFTL